MNLEKLKQKFNGDILIDEANLEKYSNDASIFQIHPQIIAVPNDAQDISELVKFVSSEKAGSPNLSITPRAGGTDMTGGCINDSIILDITKLNNIYHLTTNSVTTQAGVFYKDLEPKLTSHNLLMPAYPSSKMWCAIGGMVGNNCGGEKSLKYGQVINYVKELTVILADGNLYHIRPLTKTALMQKIKQDNFEGKLYKQIFELIENNFRIIQQAKPTTSKNSAGYYLWDVWDGVTFDLTKLFTGSQGTLGIITDVTWKLVPIQRARKLAIVYLNDISQLGSVVNHINELSPESLEVFDDITFQSAIKYWPQILAKIKGSRIKLLWRFLLILFKAWRGHIPKLVLLAEFTGNSYNEANNLAQTAVYNLREHFNLKTKLCHNFEEAQIYWTIRRESYHLLQQHNARKISAPFIEDIIVHPDQLSKFMPQLNSIIAKYPSMAYTIAGHAGDANFHIIPLVDLSIDQNREQLISLSDEVFNLVKMYQGSMTAEHNDGLVRGPFLKHMFGTEIFQLFERVKLICDPQNIFNPHKKTKATLQYYTTHIKHN